ncbi:fumarate hydratase [Agrobacterium vitis]|uniref:Fumarate hydratase class I n=1 Tax=Agrobacterium vitis TaxID=373 RepID=A0AAE2REW3_AGRVI|nr:fumarate hydratase [Agrobacterium vitis]MBF2716189.1 fumarate hydratase [Agrobacterium vitis]MUZ64649.1 fumarate hydratase [Agrobacterium vitis]MVA22667.1 fumarate hydratase [Agrobacterium vitis]
MADDLFPLGEDTTPYRKLTADYVSVETFKGQDILVVEPEGLRLLAEAALSDINHLLRPGHLKQLASILQDPEATDNDRFVAYDLLKNANIAAGGVLPMCQDTGTAIVMGKKGRRVWTDGGDYEALAHGVRDAYEKRNLRYSQLAPLKMFEEKNTKTNLPAQIDLYEEGEDAYKFLFMAKGGGSANKTFLYQGTPSLLTHDRMIDFLKDKILSLGTAACPPYHLAIVIGGLSAEMNLKTVKLASARYLDGLPTEGSESGHAFRDIEMEQEIHKLTQSLGVGAQFGGKYFCHDVRVIRLPRHGASLPIGLGVSCSADRQAMGKITRDGIFIEQLETDPSKYMPDIDEAALSSSTVSIDLNQPMEAILAELTKHPVKTRLSLTGTIIVARDLAHSKIRERLENGEGMPDYMKNHPVYYAGPAKTPEGFASGSFGPTTAGRMDSYVDQFQSFGGSMVMLAKGNRSRAVREACKTHGGFYLGSIGGPAARLAQDCIRHVEVLEYPELGMEAVWKIEVENFPAFIVTDDKGNDFFQEFNL